MVISNAKYDRKQGGVKNKAYISNPNVSTLHAAMDIHDFEIPRYEEMKFLKLEDFEE